MHDEKSESEIYTVAAGRHELTNDATDVEQQEDQSEGRKPLAQLQQEDPDIGPILQLRLQQSEQPPPEAVLLSQKLQKSCGYSGILLR